MWRLDEKVLETIFQKDKKRQGKFTSLLRKTKHGFPSVSKPLNNAGT
jgi:hypothetical protein